MLPNHSLKILVTVALLVGTILLPSITPARAAPSNSTTVRDWNATAVQLIGAVKQNPIAALRTMSMMHVAMYDALQAIATASPTGYTLDGSTLYGVSPGASPDGAVAAAARIVLLGLLPDKRAAIDAAYAASLAQVSDTPARQEGVLVGDWTAQQLLDWGSRDHSNLPNDYNLPNRIGIFQPAGGKAVFVRLGQATPFVLLRGSQFRPGPPPALSSSQYAADYNEVKSLGSVNSTARTPDETQAALFWFDDDYSNWNVAARTVAGQQNTSLAQDARLFAEVNVAMYDGLIGVFDAKYTYNSWRPDAAIHAGDVDGNAATAADSSWAPLKATPPHPDYPSAHTSSGGAASTVLAMFFGADTMSFSFATRTSPGGTARSYTAFSQAAQEEGLSRIWLGYHTRTAVNVGLLMGQETGAWVANHFGKVVPVNPTN